MPWRHTRYALYSSQYGCALTCRRRTPGKALPDVTLDRSRPDAVRLLPFDVDESSTEPAATLASAYPVTLLERHQLAVVGQECVERVEAASFYLGARTSPDDGRRRIWRYKADWVFLDLDGAKRRMEAECGPGHQVRVFHLPALAVHTAAHVLLVTDISTAEPLLHASEHIATATPFRPLNLKTAVSFMLEGQKVKQLEGMFFALVDWPTADPAAANDTGRAPAWVTPSGGVLPGAASAYAVSTLASPDKRAAVQVKGGAEPQAWTQDRLRVSAESIGELVGGRHRPRRGSLHEKGGERRGQATHAAKRSLKP